MASRLPAERDDFYSALERLCTGDLDVTEWLRWFLEQFTAAARASEQTLAHVLRRARLWMKYARSPVNERQRKTLNALLDAGPEGFVGGMTNRKYAHLTKTSPATAQRDLAELVELGSLVLTGAGRSARYELAADQ